MELSRDMRKIMTPHRKSNLSSLIIVGYENFWVFSKVENTCVSLAHKPCGKNEILFKKFSIQNQNPEYFRKNPSLISSIIAIFHIEIMEICNSENTILFYWSDRSPSPNMGSKLTDKKMIRPYNPYPPKNLGSDLLMYVLGG